MLIVFEGIDGCGKTTQAEMLASYFQNHNTKTILTGPFLTDYGKSARKLFMSSSEISMTAQIYLLSSIMSQLAFEITQLIKDHIVILDRYIYTTYAYHGCALNVGVGKIKQFYDIAVGGVQPDIIFYLDIPAQIAYKRVPIKRDRVEREPIEFYEKAVCGYRKIALSEKKFFILDALDDKDYIHREVLRYLSSL